MFRWIWRIVKRIFRGGVKATISERIMGASGITRRMYLDQFRCGDIFKAALEYGSTTVTRVPDTCILTQPAPRTRVRTGDGRNFHLETFDILISLWFSPCFLRNDASDRRISLPPPPPLSLSFFLSVPLDGIAENRPRIVHNIENVSSQHVQFDRFRV